MKPVLNLVRTNVRTTKLIEMPGNSRDETRSDAREWRTNGNVDYEDYQREKKRERKKESNYDMKQR